MSHVMTAGAGRALLAAFFLGTVALASAAEVIAFAAPGANPMLVRQHATLQGVCGSKCHRVDLFASASKGYSEWHETVQKMVDLGARATDEQLADIMDYLYQTQTLIDVNKAEPEDLAIILGVSDERARMIVFRRARKKFTSLADLQSVGGLDLVRLKKKAALLVFQ